MKKLIIIPAYNEEENIERTIKMIEKGTNDFDYVIINDYICPIKFLPFKTLEIRPCDFK